MPQDFSVAVIGEDTQQTAALAAQLQLLGERVDEPSSADALFVILKPGEQPDLSAERRPTILCCAAQDQHENQPLALNTVTTLALPAQRLPLERVLAELYAQRTSAAATEASLLPEIIGSSACALNLKHKVQQVAAGDSTVLLTGPSGTGKSFIAETIHRHSARAAAPFVPINCGAIPAELIESELFGHEKGAFTGALERRLGRFEMAAGGTLFLDEIGDMPFPMQVKLLRAIQERAFERVGGVKTLTTDVRLIAATNADLEEGVLAGSFREDLYYRINVFPIPVPSLAERIEDLELIVEHFQGQLQKQYGHAVRLTEDAIQTLKRYAWPGNLRELRNLLERLTVEFSADLLSSERLPNRYSGSAQAPDKGTVDQTERSGLLPINGIDLKSHLAELEQTLIEQALKDSDAVVARAADRLHIRRTTLVEKMRKYGIDRASH